MILSSLIDLYAVMINGISSWFVFPLLALGMVYSFFGLIRSVLRG